MEEKNKTISTVDDYIAQYPQALQEKLQTIRAVIRAAAPEAQEKIGWSMPTFAQHGNLAHFAAHKSHIGFYPGASGIEMFQDRLHGYIWSKGAVQFPYEKPLPHELITDMVRFRVEENMCAQAKREAKRNKPKGKQDV